jgi:uncharacterized protein (TIGR02453 family)
MEETTMPDAGAFEGFPREGIDFLAALAENNDRAWFTPRKADYERLVKRPLEALCLALGERFTARGIPLTSDPARSPFRIYRDVRFSRDKSPYKPYASARFPAVGGGPGGYFHLAPGDIFAGGGIWHAEPAVLRAWRTTVASSPAEVRSVLEDPAFVRTFGSVDGDRLKRVPAGFSRDDPNADLLTLKDVTFGRRLSDADVMAPSLPDLLADTYAAAGPLIALLGRVVGRTTRQD